MLDLSWRRATREENFQITPRTPFYVSSFFAREISFPVESARDSSRPREGRGEKIPSRYRINLLRTSVSDIRLMELSDETDTRIILLLAGRASRLARSENEAPNETARNPQSGRCVTYTSRRLVIIRSRAATMPLHYTRDTPAHAPIKLSG